MTTTFKVVTNNPDEAIKLTATALAGGGQVNAIYGTDANTLNLQDCPLKYIGNYAFNQGISSPGPCTIILPSSLKVVNNYGFSYLNNCLGTISFEIGNADVLSDLDFSVNNSGDNYKKFWQNETSPLNITFYSKLYDSSMDIIPGSNVTVADVFGENVESISVY